MRIEKVAETTTKIRSVNISKPWISFGGNLAEKKSTVTFPFFRRHNGRNDEIAIAQPSSTSSKSPTNGLANRVRPAIEVAFTATRMTSVKPPKKAA